MATKTLGTLLNSKAENLESMISQMDALLSNYEELVMIRDRFVNDGMTSELYDFINKRGDLKAILGDLPKEDSIPESSLEEFRIAEIQHLDIAIEGIVTSIWEFIQKIWYAFLDWLHDWTDKNRRMYFRLQRHANDFKRSPNMYGSTDQFGKTECSCYTKAEWKKMLDACNEIINLIKTIPANDIEGWYKKNIKFISKKLSEFGYDVSNEGVISISPHGPKYTKTPRVIGQAFGGWARMEMPGLIGEAMSSLKLEESTHTNEFKALERAVAHCKNEESPNVSLAVRNVVYLSKIVKDRSAHLARAINDICVQTKKNA